MSSSSEFKYIGNDPNRAKLSKDYTDNSDTVGASTSCVYKAVEDVTNILMGGGRHFWCLRSGV